MTEVTVATNRQGPGAVGSIPAALYRPEGEPGPVLVAVQEIFGRSDYLRSRCADLAALGYTVVLPQLYWRVGADAVAESEPDALERGIALSQQTNWDDAVADVQDCVAWAREQGDGRVGLIGFCYGGGLAYAALSTGSGEAKADALVSYYGSALPNLVDALEVVRAPSLHHFGDADAFIPAEQVAHIREVVESGGADFHLWPGAGHAFDNPAPAFHHAEASEQAWRTTVAWLAEHFPARR